MEDEYESTNQLDEDFNLPRTTLRKLVAECVPSDLTVSKEAYDLIGDCCLEFIHMLSSESQLICEKSSKKTVNGEHVLDALSSLGFQEFIAPTKAIFDKFTQLSREQQVARRGSKKAQHDGLTEDELAALQMKQLEEAKRRYLESLGKKEDGNASTATSPIAPPPSAVVPTGSSTISSSTTAAGTPVTE